MATAGAPVEMHEVGTVFAPLPPDAEEGAEPEPLPGYHVVLVTRDPLPGAWQAAALSAAPPGMPLFAGIPYGTVAASVPLSISRRQLLLELLERGLITAEEAEAAATVGAVPAKVAAVFDRLPPEQAIAARITWASMIEALRSDPLVPMLAAAEGKDDTYVDAVFASAAAR
nr:hypothetical protein [Roseomonas sp. SXEYE001]MCV4210404.1 hypothetical protein [Roseomonas sp. SXEYE001]